LHTISILSGNIGNTVSSDPLYRGLVTLLGWLLSRLSPNGLITTSILFWSLFYSYLANYSCKYWLVKYIDYMLGLSYYSIYSSGITVE